MKPKTTNQFTTVGIFVVDLIVMSIISFLVIIGSIVGFTYLLPSAGFTLGLPIGLIASIILCLIFGLGFYRNRKNVKKVDRFGWILTLIALIIVLCLTFFFLFSSSTGGGTVRCIPDSEFICQMPVYNHLSGRIIVTIGQNTGSNWTSANFVFVPQGTLAHQIYQPVNAFIPNVSFISYPANATYGYIGLKSGQQKQISLQVDNINPPVPIGTATMGSIWAEFTTQGYSTPQYTEIANLNTKAT
jgi:uncharacterized membrane protein (UPF0136 family)